MTRRGLIRLVGVASAALLALAASGFAWTAVASAHVVTGIEAGCTHVTVSFADFPKSGVPVHIAVTVTGHVPIATDVLVDKHSGPASLDISSATSDLFGATAKVDVDVTWTFEGPQHVQQTLYVTCGETTSTAAASSSTESTEFTSSTIGGEESSTTDTSGTTSSTAGNGNTSTSDTAATSSSATAGPVGGGGLGSTTSSSEGHPTSGAIKVAGESVSAPSATVASAATGAGQSGTLPFTGAAAVPLAVSGVAALTLGAAAVSAARRRRRLANP